MNCIQNQIYCRFFGLADDIPCGECADHSKFEPESHFKKEATNHVGTRHQLRDDSPSDSVGHCNDADR